MVNRLFIAVAATVFSAFVASLLLKTGPFQPEGFMLYPPLSALGPDTIEEVLEQRGVKNMLTISIGLFIGVIVYIIIYIKTKKGR
jgi:hypothetical protein